MMKPYMIYKYRESIDPNNYTDGDLKDHLAMAAIIRHPDNDDRILVFKHKKFDVLTVPIGKADDDETPEQSLIRELEEECGIKPTAYNIYGKYAAEYKRIDHWVKTESTCFNVTSFTGQVINKEPDKHYDFKFLTMDEILDLIKTNKISDSLKYIIKTWRS